MARTYSINPNGSVQIYNADGSLGGQFPDARTFYSWADENGENLTQRNPPPPQSSPPSIQPQAAPIQAATPDPPRPATSSFNMAGPQADMAPAAWNPFDPYGTNLDFLKNRKMAPETPPAPPEAPPSPAPIVQHPSATSILNTGVEAYGLPAPAPPPPEPPPYVYTPPPPSTPPPPPQHSPIPYNPANPGPYGLEKFDPLDPSGIPSINLPQPEQISSTWAPGFEGQYTDFMNRIAGQMKNQYDYALPTLQPQAMNTDFIPHPNAAQFNGIPRPTAAQFGGVTPYTAQTFGGVAPVTAQQYGASPELDWMNSGQGYDPKTIALMRSRAIDDVSGSGRTEMAQAKRALEQSGLGSSPAGAAVAGDVARRSGIAQNSALRNIDIQDAMAGLENRRLGLGYQTQIGLANTGQANQIGQFNAGLAQQTGLYNAGQQNEASQFNAGQAQQAGLFNAGQANQMASENANRETNVGLSNMQAANAIALANANRLFAGMSQNLSNAQDTNLAQFGAEASRLNNRAGANVDFLGQQGNMFGQATLNKAGSAEEKNVANKSAWETEQARLERQRQLANQNVLETRFTNAGNWLTGNAGGWTPLPSQQPTSVPNFFQ